MDNKSSAAPKLVQILTFKVNDQPRQVSIEPPRTLLDVLRHDLGLTGTKKVCEMGASALARSPGSFAGGGAY